MTGEDLRDVLGRAAGPAADERPDLAGLWGAGRARRQRRRVLAGTAALVAVAAMVAGGVVLASDGDDQEVATAPPTGPVAAPPAEPTDGLVTMEVTAGPVVEGLPTAEPGEPMEVSYGGLSDQFPRGRRASWEVWDGETWTETLYLIAGDGEPGGFPGTVTPTAPPPTVPADARTGPGPDVFPTPGDLDPGSYRVCMPMTSQSDGGVAETTLPAPPPGQTAPETRPATTFTAGQQIRPCAQLRVPEVASPPDRSTEPDPGGSDEPADDAPPVASQAGPVRMAGPPELAVGAPFTVELEIDGGAVSFRSPTVSWEAWVGTGWARTHDLSGGPARPHDPDMGTDLMGIDAAGPLALVAPADVAVRTWVRVCVDVNLLEGRTHRPCLGAVVVPSEPGAEPSDGDDATWEIDPVSPPTATSTTVDVLVTPFACGPDTRALGPEVDLGDDRITITVDVQGSTEDADCAAVPVTVVLGEAIGERPLLDGWCQGTNRNIRCQGEAELRWSPPGG